MRDEKSEVGEISDLPVRGGAAELRNSPDVQPDVGPLVAVVHGAEDTLAPLVKAAPARKPVTKAGGRGKRVTIFLHECDRRIIRELMAYLAGQERRVSESIAIKAALRMAKPGGDLLRAHEDAASPDLRFKH